MADRIKPSVRAFWGRVISRAWKDVVGDTPLVSPIRLFIALSSVVGGFIAWGLGGTQPVGAEYALAWVAFVIGLAVFWKLISVPSKIAAEDKAKHDAELSAVTAERDAAVVQLTAKPPRDDRYDFALSLHVDVNSDIFSAEPIPMKWHLKLTNRGTIPIEFQHIEIDGMFGDGPGSSSYGQGSVLRPGENTRFSFTADPSHWLADGVLNVTVRARYGPAHGRPSRNLTKSMRIQYRYRGALSDSTCHTVSESEEDIPESAIN